MLCREIIWIVDFLMSLSGLSPLWLCIDVHVPKSLTGRPKSENNNSLLMIVVWIIALPLFPAQFPCLWTQSTSSVSLKDVDSVNVLTFLTSPGTIGLIHTSKEAQQQCQGGREGGERRSRTFEAAYGQPKRCLSRELLQLRTRLRPPVPHLLSLI